MVPEAASARHDWTVGSWAGRVDEGELELDAGPSGALPVSVALTLPPRLATVPDILRVSRPTVRLRTSRVPSRLPVSFASQDRPVPQAGFTQSTGLG